MKRKKLAVFMSAVAETVYGVPLKTAHPRGLKITLEDLQNEKALLISSFEKAKRETEEGTVKEI